MSEDSKLVADMEQVVDDAFGQAGLAAKATLTADLLHSTLSPRQAQRFIDFILDESVLHNDGEFIRHVRKLILPWYLRPLASWLIPVPSSFTPIKFRSNHGDWKMNKIRIKR